MKRHIGGVRHDYKDTLVAASPETRPRRWVLFVVGLSVPLLGVLLVMLGTPRRPLPPSPTATVALEPLSEVAPLPAPLDASLTPVETSLFEAPAEAPIVPGDAAATLDVLVERGDTLEQIFRRNGLDLRDLAAMVSLPEAAGTLKLLKPGDRLEIDHRDGEVVALRRELDEVNLLTIQRGEHGFGADTIARDLDVRTTGAHSVIKSSLFEAGAAAGIADGIIMRMAGIFEWDIDFIQDVREGDSFTVIYEELWRDGVKLRDGSIVAAEFVNQGRVYRAARFRDPDGRVDHYTPDGRSVRKAFIRAPINFTRISSGFNPNRKHPVLNTIRAHRGVDYAAPIGTPIRAAGDGKVLFRGQKGGYGNTIILQHGGNITTLYGHMSRFASARVGTRVKQGDVIGYVGKTGLATGPHLHYEYRINGVHRNPRTVDLPAAEPVPARYQNEFRAATDPLWRELDLFDEDKPITTAKLSLP